MFTVMQSTFITNCLRQQNFDLHVSGYCIPYQLQSRFLTIHCKAGFVKVKMPAAAIKAAAGIENFPSIIIYQYSSVSIYFM